MGQKMILVDLVNTLTLRQQPIEPNLCWVCNNAIFSRSHPSFCQSSLKLKIWNSKLFIRWLSRNQTSSWAVGGTWGLKEKRGGESSNLRVFPSTLTFLFPAPNYQFCQNYNFLDKFFNSKSVPSSPAHKWISHVIDFTLDFNPESPNKYI